MEPDFHYHDTRGRQGRCWQCQQWLMNDLSRRLCSALSNCLIWYDDIEKVELQHGVKDLVAAIDAILDEWPRESR